MKSEKTLSRRSVLGRLGTLGGASVLGTALLPVRGRGGAPEPKKPKADVFAVVARRRFAGGAVSDGDYHRQQFARHSNGSRGR